MVGHDEAEGEVARRGASLERVDDLAPEALPGESTRELDGACGLRILPGRKQFDHGPRERTVITRTNQASAASVGYGIGDAAHVESHRRQAARRGFDRDHAEAFDIARHVADGKDVHVGALVGIGEFAFAAWPEPAQRVGDAGRFGNAFAFCVLLLLIVVSVMGAMSLLLRGRNDVRTQIGAGA